MALPAHQSASDCAASDLLITGRACLELGRSAGYIMTALLVCLGGSCGLGVLLPPISRLAGPVKVWKGHSGS